MDPTTRRERGGKQFEARKLPQRGDSSSAALHETLAPLNKLMRGKRLHPLEGKEGRAKKGLNCSYKGPNSLKQKRGKNIYS